ncbi:MAG: NAD-dependent epimerase/dehydratase family protein [Chloroflexota bacterium]|nr:MAG: NAD-dependent epimerase/dehydratase family protein [Chloroflexota bacterium]
MRVVVTGATGFVGSHLVDRLLADEAEVSILARASSSVGDLERRGVGVTRIEYSAIGPLRDAVAGADVVYHVASVIKALHGSDFRAGNIDVTRNLAFACATTHPRPAKLVVMSSQAAAGPSWPGRRRSEAHAPAPVSPYGASKLMAERAALAVENPVDTLIARPTTVYGPRDPALAIIFQVSRFGIAPALPLNPELSLIHVSDLVSGIIQAGRSATEHGRAYFLGHPESRRFDDLVASIARASGRQRMIRIALPAVAVVAAGLTAGLTQRVRRQARPFDLAKAMDVLRSSWVVDVSRARDELAFTAETPHDDGLRSTAAWYRDNASGRTRGDSPS